MLHVLSLRRRFPRTSLTANEPTYKADIKGKRRKCPAKAIYAPRLGELELELTLTLMIQKPVLGVGVFARSQVKNRALPIGEGGG